MQVIHYNPLTYIIINAEPSIGIIGNWNAWTSQEDFLIQQAKKENPGRIFTMINLISTKNSMQVISENGLQALGTQNGLQKLVQYFLPVEQLSRDKTTVFFEPFKTMFHLQKVYLLQNHPELEKIIQVLGAEKVIVLDPIKDDGFLQKSQKALKTGNLKSYHELIGANFDFSGEVVKGKQLGRTIGYPTANVKFAKGLPIRLGVYLVKVKIPNDTQEYWGMADYWKHPTTGLTFETYIFDFDQEIYGWIINVELVAFYRDNLPIADLNTLKHQLDQDQAVLKKWVFKFKEK